MPHDRVIRVLASLTILAFGFVLQLFAANPDAPSRNGFSATGLVFAGTTQALPAMMKLATPQTRRPRSPPFSTGSAAGTPSAP
jgi:hypothetical protein